MKKIVLLILLSSLFLAGIFVYQQAKFNDGKLHIVICNVGQGDALFIRTPSGQDVLIDGGPDKSVLTCLSNHMPFWDRDIELMILTHPHTDHFIGLVSVLKNYEVKAFATEELKNKAAGFDKLMNLIVSKSIPIRRVLAGDRFILKDGVRFEIVGPTEEFIKKTSPGGFIGESGEFASVETLLRYGKFSAVFTGDSQAIELKEAIDKDILGNVVVLQVPHHGSKTGLDSQVLGILQPSLAVISVGAKNKYGHPNPITLDLLKQFGIKTLRTDQNGEVEIISDGSSWGVK